MLPYIKGGEKSRYFKILAKPIKLGVGGACLNSIFFPHHILFQNDI